MADDIITFGGPGRRSRREAGESGESLFHAHYPRVVYTAFFLVGEWDLAGQLAQDAYLRLWRRWRRIGDPQAAPMYLQRTVVKLSRETIRRKVIERRAPWIRGADRGGVRIAPNSCGQQACSQIYYTPGSVWVPTAQFLIRIATSGLPERAARRPAARRSATAGYRLW